MNHAKQLRATYLAEEAGLDLLPVHRIDTNAGATSGGHLAVEPVAADIQHLTPHRHSFTQIVFVERGSGINCTDFSRIRLTSGDIHILAQGQVHSWEALDGLDATAAMFTESALDPAGPVPDELRELLLFGSAPIAMPPPAHRRVVTLLASLAETGSVEVGRHLVLALLWECLHVLEALPERRGDHHPTSLSRAFMRFALQAPSARRSVSECATLLAVTPSYLNEHITRATGRTPGQILRTALTREAQRQLSGTTMTASQIATLLGFSTPSYFSRFFRREVGISPRDYRSFPQAQRPDPHSTAIRSLKRTRDAPVSPLPAREHRGHTEKKVRGAGSSDWSTKTVQA